MTAVKKQGQSIFIKAEEEFRMETASNSIREINIDKLISNLVANSEVISNFNAIIEYSGLKYVDAEITENLLSTMLKLFLRVRSYSLSRDIIEKHRQKLKIKKAKGGLRMSLKKSSIGD